MHTKNDIAEGKLGQYGHQEAYQADGGETASIALKRTARDAIHRAQREIVGLSHQLHANPELAFAEYESARAITDLLERHGFEIERGIADLETAFVATSGHGELVVAFCAEMDALPEVGHACGHNVIAAASVAAAIALAEVADTAGVCVKVFGTPAEEAGGGKIIMLEAGAFDGVHAAMMVHPATKEYADHHTRAVVGLRASYTGRTAHSAVAPHEGINAGDAATVAQVAIGLLRQQLLPGALVHGIVTKGGEAANSIPGAAELLYDARANNVKELGEVKKQLIACFEAGAVATGASLHITEETREFSEFRNDQPMVGFYQANAESLGRRFDDEPLEKRLSEAASTDMANVSLAIPSIHPVIRVEAHGASNHQPEFARWCASEDADKAALEGGAAMAWTAIDLALDTTERRRLITVGEYSAPGAEAADF
ncbi:amidohydrolase [Arthrobacter sp. B2a2-09]|uniref:amidohydrolase n=1 Tax=Arthrobacter sp. B2a2-09 TaxID=2952822 RepID=UPI0022CD4FD1|nr:amidohydrolase [Arthrobacter sp. B2a2-09]MCZ9882857.1 amidohydrolase [Arthrobacter sp. B2a2-09]